MKKLLSIALLMFVINLSSSQNLVDKIIKPEPIQPHKTPQTKYVWVPEYVKIFPKVMDSLIKIESNNIVAYINLQGEYVYGFNSNLCLNSQTNQTGNFKNGVTILGKREGYTLNPVIITFDKRIHALPKEYGKVTDFCDGVVLAEKTIKTGNQTITSVVFLNNHGKEVYPKLNHIVKLNQANKLEVRPVCENRRAYYNYELRKWGFADAAGNIVVQPQFDNVVDFSEGLAAVAIKKEYDLLWGFIDTTGKLVIPHKFETTNDFRWKKEMLQYKEGLAIYAEKEGYNDAKFGYLNKKGEKVTAAKFVSAKLFSDGFAVVEYENE